MNQETIYAVVDLETTGTNIKEGDRIIQFGCALVQNGKIIQTISQDVNPLREVPTKIQHLTHITADQLELAPIFEDLAPTLVELLSGTVFVAHNINFDLPFLNGELERVGQKPLNLSGIDTVELAQIILPEAPSYRLQDLTQLLAIEHDNPHQADSDALVTAKLFLKLMGRLKALPLVTLERLSDLGAGLLRQTGDFFTVIANQMHNQSRPLPNNLLIRENIALRKPAAESFEIYPGTSFAADYPLNESAKKSLLKPHLKWRKAQATMMDMIHNNFEASTPEPLLIEAATGLGKTIGYLLPYSYRMTPTHKLVVATSTTLLQDQILTQARPLLEKLVGRQINAEVVKSPRHYLDLHRFELSLRLPHKNRMVRLLQMKILVWLTQTTTGDLDELNLTSYQTPFFNNVQHRGLASLQPQAPFYHDDFLRRLHKRQQQAELLVTNHAYLAEHAADHQTWGAKPYLVLDEAQNMIFNVQKTAQQAWELSHWQLWTQKGLQYTDSDQTNNSLVRLFPVKSEQARSLKLVHKNLKKLNRTVAVLQTYLTTAFVLPQPKAHETFSERYLNPDEVVQFVTACHQDFNQLNRQLLTIQDHFLTLRFWLEQHLEQYTESDLSIWQSFENDINLLLADIEAYQHFEQLFITTIPQERHALMIQMTQPKQPSQLPQFKLQWQLLSAGSQTQQILSHFEPVTLTGATLAVNGRFDYIQRELGFTADQPLITKKLRSPFRFKQQARFFIAEDGPNQKQLMPNEYQQAIAEQLLTLLIGNSHQALVLFNSNQTLERVYYALSRAGLSLDREILAQGITGSAEKITKRFMLGHDSILLATSSFIAGVDFPESALELVILVQLPFDAPNALQTRIRYAQLSAQGINPFKAEALPKATIKLRQAFGRLIRTPNDRGVFICLDARLLTTQYGHQMRRSLPTSLPQKAAPVQTIRELTDLFWLNSH
ncbi:helicase C-terminal domain-containing protein [Latilactobacillus graminis]|uniref:3'-5' exonuclease DinG n=2 Tax=Latilactobacillus graminis TaxID=60519 RepID=A0AA89I1S0_9LACO|nr:helicase C-terminal domain-containing protein [Latilactobacillus graminis]KRM22239.1 dnaQ exonuclease DinG family helicase [Latilactobacillus graminis DSM 20719]QFP79585.1 ATP-dependent helicase [Latilactobacillus graminis]